MKFAAHGECVPGFEHSGGDADERGVEACGVTGGGGDVERGHGGSQGHVWAARAGCK